MRVLVDGAWAGQSGIGRYAEEVMARVPAGTEVRPLERRLGAGHALSPLSLALGVRRLGGDVFWSPGFMPPANASVPFVITIHDLNHRVYYGVKHRFYYDSILRPLARRAASIITVSRRSQSAIAHWLGLPESRVRVSYIGLDTTLFRADGPTGSTEYGPYYLCLASCRPNKNLPVALASFARARLPGRTRLVIAGAALRQVQRMVLDAGLGHRVVFTGAVGDRELASLYRGAVGFLYPSLAEGFGLPVLEALACGATVVASRSCPSVCEIASDCVVEVDPISVESVAGGIEAVQGGAALRARFRALGAERVRLPLLRWDGVAEVVWSEVRRVGGNVGRPAMGGA